MPIPLAVPSVNFHLWQPCNMRCGFCFATFQDVKRTALPKGHLPRKDAAQVVDALADAGFQKINFAGGEPTLCPWLAELIDRAKSHGLVTSIVTNGSRLDAETLDALSANLDWIALSIDSVDPGALVRTGRALNGKPISADEYLRIAEGIKSRSIRLKINTVVTSENWREDFADFITAARPERWKIFQALPVAGQNDGRIQDYAVSAARFDGYVRRNRSAVESAGIAVVPESNELMTASYVMVDPAGRFFDNARGAHAYSRAILDVGVDAALSDVSVDPARFAQRGGLYDWRGDGAAD